MKKILLAILLLAIPLAAYSATVVTIEDRTVFGNKRIVSGYVTLSGAYSTGYALTPTNLGLRKVDYITFAPRIAGGTTTTNANYLCTWDATSEVIRCYCYPDTAYADAIVVHADSSVTTIQKFFAYGL